MKKKEVSVKPLIYFIFYILGLISVMFIGVINAKALTITDYEVTWYYRKQSNESSLLNEIKPYNEPSITVDGEYINGYSTRAEYSFTKDMQYIISYNLFLQYSLSDDSNLRSDLLTRIENNCYADNDFKVLDCTAKQISKNCGEGCDLTINVTQQVKAINTTNAIRFGVYPNSNFSLGFYNHDSTIYNYMQNINVNDNSSGAIIDQNNQMIDQNNEIIQGQDKIENSIIESNKETQEVIKDQFNSCRDSINMINPNEITWTSGILNDNGIFQNSSSSHYTDTYWEVKPNSDYTISGKFVGASTIFKVYYYDENKNWISRTAGTYSSPYTFKTTENTKYIRFQTAVLIDFSSGEVMLQEGSIATDYEPYGEKICQNKIDDTNNKLDNLQGALTDSSPTDMSELEDSIGWLPPGPIDSILNLPLALFNSLSRNLSNKTCMTATLELPFVNKTLNLPCVKSLYDKIGITGTLFQSTGIIASCFILFNYLLSLYHWVDKTLTLRENTMPGYYEDNWGGGA